MTKFLNQEGKNVTVKAYMHKIDCMGLKEVSPIELPCEFIQHITDSGLYEALSNEVYSIEEVAASKGTSKLPNVVTILSTYFQTFAIKRSGGSYNAKFVILIDNEVVLTIYNGDKIVKL